MKDLDGEKWQAHRAALDGIAEDFQSTATLAGILAFVAAVGIATVAVFFFSYP